MILELSGKLNGKVKVPTSKSHLIRALIFSMFCKKQTKLTNVNCLCDDVLAAIDCLRNLGTLVSVNKNTKDISVLPKKIKKNATINCRESACVLRFMLVILGTFDGKFKINFNNNLAKRKIEDFLEFLKTLNLNITTEKNIIHFSGKLSTGVFKIPTNITSQYISAFLIALPYLNQSKIYFENTKSNKYIEITKNLAKKFGVTYEKQNSYYTSKGSYLSPEKIHIEGDWSSASFWYAANINKKNNVMIYNLNKNSLSSDKIILELINKIKNNKETIISANDIPDLIPILTLVSSIFGKTTIIKNIERLRYKESNRVENLKECLNNIGAKIETFENYMVVNNVKTLKGGIGKTFFDHRLAMTLAIASTFSEKPITINNAECVSKSYPGFYNDFHLLGGNVKILS